MFFLHPTSILLICATLLPRPWPAQCQQQREAPAFRTEQPEFVTPTGGDDDFSLEQFAHALRIEKDQQDPSRLLNVFLPAQRQSVHFRQFIARVADISAVDEPRTRDANRTFLASLADSSVINVHGLSPGHKYQVAILGRREAESLLIREDQVLMDPVPLDFGVVGNSSAIVATHHNITMHAQKPERALQDTFRVEYHQLDPLKRFPILDVHDIQEQREVELYLGNLAPGRDFAISVTSLREELPSQPWRGIVTTRPLRPTNLSLAELNASCVLLQWQFPPESGADRFKVAYGMLHGAQSMLKLETQYPVQQAQLCQQIVPGRVFIFAVIAEKSRQISEPATLSHTVRPLPPRELTVEPDFEKARFRVRVHLAPEEESHTEKCLIGVQPEEEGARHEQSTVPVQQGQLCEAFFELQPGKRYELSATALSGQAASTRVLRNRAMEPGFDFAAFGLTLREGEGGGTLRLEWPQSEVARLRIADLWARIVGRDSHLHFSVQPLEEPGPSSQRETGPTEPGAVLVEGVREGECYKVLLYTVTASGIVSEQRFEQHLRTAPPQVDLAVGQLSARAATLQAFLFRPRQPSAAPVSAQCQLQVLVSDVANSELVLDRTLPLNDQQKSPSIQLDGLKPWRKYAANAQVTCGAQQGQSPCAPKVQRLARVEFRTEPAPPGPIVNFTMRPLNPYSAHLRWQAPEEPNGRISHYIVQIDPQGEEPLAEEDAGSAAGSRPWTERVSQPAEANGGADRAELQPDGSESLLPRSGPVQVERVLDGLAGGRNYRVEVWPVNEAGQGRGSGQVALQMPIAAPPRPGRAIQPLADTVRSRELSVRLELAQLSERNGRLVKLALVVAELDEQGEPLQDNAGARWEEENGTLPTWAMARRAAGQWPPFVALELLPDQKTHRIGPAAVVEKVGTQADCGDRPPETICNGPLKPGAAYRLKLRLFTAPHLWTDSLYSEPVHLEPPVGESTIGQALLLLLVAAILVGTGTGLVLLRRRHKKPKSSFCRIASTHCRNRHAAESQQQQQQRSREGQWQALKMIMAERAADCLAKLGLDPAPVQPEKMGAPDGPSTSSPRSAPHGNVLCGGGIGSNQLFGAPHHRRSKSLRERTGVDQRLERLPSGPPLRQSALPWTVLKCGQPERSRPVQVADFIEHVRLMSADSDFRFSEEYEELRTVGLGQSCSFADSPANRAKNRFTNILPYDHSRVKLKPTDDEEGSDYVNASYIPGFNSRREFIAAQGPLPSTRDHFWRLVWEQQVPAIVALTKCVEKGRDKCHQYWPDNSQRSVLYADIEVTLLTESIEYEEFAIRELRLTNLADPSQPARTVQHLHYQAWPDFGVPEHPAGIVHFARLFRNKLPPSPANKPTIVHCSAGVGRSGTFIALDRLMQQIATDSSKPIDVFGTVYEMRMERCHMVQNEQQYIFIHQAIQYVLENFFPFLMSPASHPSAGDTPSRISNSHLPFGSSISSPICGGTYAPAGSTSSPAQTQHTFTLPNGSWSNSNQQTLGQASWPNLPPKIEVHQHQNEGFLEDDEGIAESGL